MPHLRLVPAIGSNGAVLILGVTQILGYGTLYYSFGILAADMAATLGWSTPSVFGAFSAALLAGGFVAPEVGRRMDRQGAPMMMAAGSAMAAASLLVLGMSNGPVGFIAGLVLIQIASSLVLYDAAFACLVQLGGLEAGRRITHLTLIAGFASTLFWPLTSWLHTVLAWQTVLFLFAAVNVAVCLPLHLLLRRVRSTEMMHLEARAPDAGAVQAEHHPLPPTLQRKAIILVSLGFALGGFVNSAVLAQMVPLLTALGLGGSSVLVSTLFGPSQVLIRLVNMTLGRSHHPIAPALLSAALLPAALALILLPWSGVVGACVFAIVLGCGSGLKSIVQGTLPLALFGRLAYAERLGRIASVRLVLTSVAPFVLAWLIEVAGPRFALAILAAIGLAGVGALVQVARMQAGVMQGVGRGLSGGVSKAERKPS
jgi:MFS family permease